MVASPLCWIRNSLISSNASPSLLAHHLTAAGETEHAVNQWLKAGRHAAVRLAHVEAISHFERDLATLAALPEDPVRDGLEIELQLARGSSLFTAHGFNATDAATLRVHTSRQCC